MKIGNIELEAGQFDYVDCQLEYIVSGKYQRGVLIWIVNTFKL